ncbi:MAG: PSD1 domain-containing protein [Verrucomicrobiae bacterium]|nr:PSD1 domain-containing protein [Verrucomicrobiae bacterium]
MPFLIQIPSSIRITALLSACWLSHGTLGAVDFVRDVRPIFQEHCYRCHGAEKQKSGLRLDVKEAALQGGSGHAPDIIPDSAGSSPLIQFVRGDDPEMRMPKDGDPLSKAEIATLTQWINEGAKWPNGVDLVKLENKSDHWSFKPVTHPERPRTKDVAWPKSEIDHFILARLEKEGLTPSPEADRVTWLRRVTFDLTGLPPTPTEVSDFLADRSELAWKRVVDRLLESPRYGERWAQHWLDVVRYADTHGFEVNTERPYAWPYRDFVIDSFNQDTPWNQFIREQIAGDAFGKPEATGFLVTAAALLPGQIGKDEESKRLARQDELGEIVINAGEAFLGLSIGCARCHDHKFDPIPARDYYSMQAFFSGVTYGDRPIENPEVDAIVARLKTQIAPLDRALFDCIVSAGSGTTRSSVSARANIERFAPVKTSKVRFTINATISDNLREPFIDELEVFDTEGNNLSLGKVKVTVSGGSKKEVINDGIYGNASCWRSNVKGGGWVEMEFPEAYSIEQIRWGRDRTGQYADRLAVDYMIQISTETGEWKTVADSKDRAPFDSAKAKADLFQPADLVPAHRQRAVALLAQREPFLSELKQYAGGKQFVFAARSNAPEPMHLLNRGDPEQPKEEVSPATLSLFEPIELPKNANDIERRQALAKWITRPDHPLTARVMVNRIWQWHFGFGLVETSNDFGRAGAEPSHPELLDWLASEFVRSGWSVKHLHRLITLSSTYRQSNRIDPKAQAVDADTRLLWRFPSRRLEAEAIRDSTLAVSGRLNPKAGGRGFDLFKSRGGLSGFPPIESFDESGRRRMIYAHKVRMEREIVFGAFDCPDAGQSVSRRRQSTTPIQALNLFNSVFTIEESEALAKRIESEVGADYTNQVQQAYQLAYARRPRPEELADAVGVVSEHGLPTLCRVIFNSSEFLFMP